MLKPGNALCCVILLVGLKKKTDVMRSAVKTWYSDRSKVESGRQMLACHKPKSDRDNCRFMSLSCKNVSVSGSVIILRSCYLYHTQTVQQRAGEAKVGHYNSQCYLEEITYTRSGKY